MKKYLILIILLITTSIYGKDILQNKEIYDFGVMETQHTRTDGVNFTRKHPVEAKPLFGKNYIQVYKIYSYDRSNEIPHFMTFYLFNLKTKKRETIKVPLFDFFNNNKNLFFDGKVLKTYKAKKVRGTLYPKRVFIKPKIKILHYSKDSSGYLLSEYKISKVSGKSIFDYKNVYLYWDHKTNKMWGKNLNGFDTKAKIKIIDYDEKNQKLYFYNSHNDDNPRINLLSLDIKTQKVELMHQHKLKRVLKSVYIHSAHPFNDFNSFIFLEYSEKRKNQPKGYLFSKKDGKYSVKSFNIPLTSYGVDINKDETKLFIASNKERTLTAYNLKTLKIIKKRKIRGGVHRIVLFDNDKKLMVFYNSPKDGKRGIGIYYTKNLKLIKYDRYDRYIGKYFYFMGYDATIIKDSKQIIFPLKTDYTTTSDQKGFFLLEYK